MSQRVGIGIIGAGFLAETRARCYRKVAGVTAELVAVASRSRDRAESFAQRFAVPEVCEVEELLARADVDVVDLCVPNAVHRSLTEAAAAAGKHVICTKPLTAYVGQDLDPGAADDEIATRDRRRMLATVDSDARAMCEATEHAGVQLMYGENWIYAPAIARAARLLSASAGSILEMRGHEGHSGSHSPYSKSWRHTGGGALLRLGAHPIGAMLYLKREEGMAKLGHPIQPVSVTAEVADTTRVAGLSPDATRVATGWEGVENWGCAIVTFDDDSRGVAYGSDTLLGGMESQLEVFASDCHLKCNLSPNDMLRSYAPDATVFGDEYIMEKVDSGAGWNTPMPDEDWTSGQLAMCQEFAMAIAEQRPVASDGALGHQVARVVYAAYCSAAEGRRIDL